MEEDRREKNPEHQHDLTPYEPKDREISTHIRHIEEELEEEVHLRDYFNVIMRRKWIVAVFFISVVITVTLITFMTEPVYKSTVTIKIDKEPPKVLAFEDVYQIERIDADYYETQYKILSSRNIAKRVIKKLHLDRHKEFIGDGKGFSLSSILSSMIGFLKSGKGKVSTPIYEDGVRTDLIDAFLERVEVQPVKKSQLVRVSFKSHDPDLAKKVANTIADTYIEFNLDSKVEATKQARQWLEKQIEVIRAKVEESEEKLNKYASLNEVIFLDETKDRESILTQRLSEISTALSEATNIRIQKESIYREIKASGDNSPYILDNPLIQDLKKKYVSLESEYYELLKIYKPEYTKMKALKNQMIAISKRIDLEKTRIIKAIESDYKTALRREKYLKKLFEKTKKELLDFQNKMVQYQILKREVDTNRQLYNNMLQRLKEVGVSATMTATNIQIIDRAEYPEAPFKPKKSLNIMLSILVGLFGGVGLAFFVEYFDNSVKDLQDVEKRINLPSLGVIPHFKDFDSTGNELVTLSDSANPLSEAFRSIGTFIMLSSASKPPKTILITSPGSGDGKTTVVCNTAASLIKSLKRGIVIDADLRKPMLNQKFGITNEVGLSTFLSGNIEFNEGLIKKTNIQGLDIITSGPIPPNPSELLGSARMRDLLDALYTLYDFVLIDSAPVLGMTDSLYLSNFTEGVIIVIKAGKTSRDALKETKRLLNKINAKILGVVLNDLKEQDMKYGYYYYYSSYYSSYYKQEDT
jgi:capsular exopolysaccharide synthesis family protein